MTVKTRNHILANETSSYGLVVGDNKPPSYDYVFTASQTTDSTGHPWGSRKKRPGRDIGGFFQTDKTTHDCGGTRVRLNKGDVPRPGNSFYVANLIIHPFRHTGGSAQSAIPSLRSQAAMNAAGSIGVARALPTNSVAGLGQALGELREGLPKAVGVKLAGIQFQKNWNPAFNKYVRGMSLKPRTMKRAAKQMPKALASEYLNVVFGWIPLIKDVKDAVKAVTTRDKIISQYVRDSGRNVRRKSTILDVSNTVETVLQSKGSATGSPALPVYCFKERGTLIRTVTTSNKLWFSGCFTYHVPSDKTVLGKIRRQEALANKLFGLRLTPELWWQLSPWSWAADWVGNTGSVLHNLSAFSNDGLVMRYGYVMETVKVVTTYTLVDCVLRTGQKVDSSQTYVQERKQRRRATPFGFGLNPASFSDKQWSIIAALGISRMPRSL